MNGCGSSHALVLVLRNVQGGNRLQTQRSNDCTSSLPALLVPAPRCDGGSETICILFLIDNTLAPDAKLESGRNCREGVDGHR